MTRHGSTHSSGVRTHRYLWSWTRHPNFSGEAMCWIGITISASNLGSVCSWAPLVAAASPAMTAVLMLFEAGLLAEWKNNHRYGVTRNYPGTAVDACPALPVSPTVSADPRGCRCVDRAHDRVPGLSCTNQCLRAVPTDTLREAPSSAANHPFLRLGGLPPVMNNGSCCNSICIARHVNRTDSS